MSKIPTDVDKFISVVQSNNTSVIPWLQKMDLNDEKIPLQMLVNLRRWDALQYAVQHSSRSGVLLSSAAYNQWFEAMDLILPYASQHDIISAAKTSANGNKIEALEYLEKHCESLNECVLPACFSRAKPILHFLLERGVAQSVRDRLKGVTRENDPEHFSLVYGEKMWGALDFLRTETTRWELENATKNCGATPKNKKI